MKSATQLLIVAAAVLFLTSLSTSAQSCRLQLRYGGTTNLKFYTILYVSFATTNSCSNVKVAVDWSDDLRTWNPVALVGGPCLTQGAEVQVIDETNAQTRLRRFYRARAVAACP